MKSFAVIMAALVGVAVAHGQDAEPEPEVAGEEASVPTSEDRLEALDTDQVRVAIEALRGRHLESASLDGGTLERATLRGLLSVLGPGVEITGKNDPAPDPSPFLSETLDGRIGYVRLGTLQSESLMELDAALAQFGNDDIRSLVLDLRATPESQDFALAAAVADRFVPSQTELFQIVRPGGGENGGRTSVASVEPVFRGVLAVVVDDTTRGATEVLAAVLSRQARALLVGATTGGRAVEFAELPLGGDHRLRFAAAEVRVPGVPAIYPDGLRPDVEVVQEEDVRERLLALAAEGGVAPLVFDKARAQMNEAALVAGTNPEISGAFREVAEMDRPLQRAVDLVTAVDLLRRAN